MSESTTTLQKLRPSSAWRNPSSGMRIQALQWSKKSLAGHDTLYQLTGVTTTRSVAARVASHRILALPSGGA